MENNVAMREVQSPPQLQQQPPPPAAAVKLMELVFSLEQATQMAKQLPTTSDSTYLLQIYSSLHQAHHSLTSILSATESQFSIPQPPPPPPPVAENSISSATGAAYEDGSEPMQMGDENEAEAEENSKTSIDKVEERMRECFIKNKRAKRRLSPLTAAMVERSRIFEDKFVGDMKGFDLLDDKLRALDLVYQFHG
ncbi:hypothetical protein DITRI_Ditri13aG0031000 [Diplodiscus trichospermus]